MSVAAGRLPVPVMEAPHWRVNIRPGTYVPDVIPSLSQCVELIEKNRVRLRGWDYPHLSLQKGERGQGRNWVASWSAFMGHCEYWRLYQSSQFVHLFSVRESTEAGWREKLQADTESHLKHYKGVDWNQVPGFLSVINFSYCVTEVVEFAARMAQSGFSPGTLNLRIDVIGIRDFVLTTSPERGWWHYYAASEDVLGNSWTQPIDRLVSDTTQCVTDILVWFFERFGWMDPPVEVLRDDVDRFRSGRR
jgi:hypothetical protein